jgi:hypothetical protein
MKTAEELAWAAGLFEGEGCLSFVGRRGPHGRRNVRASLSMADADVVWRFASIMGTGSVYAQPRPGRDLTTWTTTCLADFELLVERLSPYFGERRRARVVELVRVMNLPPGNPGRRGPRRKLSIADVRAIRQSNETQRVLAERFSVTQSAISYVQSRRTWAKVV